MADNRLPTTMPFENAEALHPFMIMSNEGDRLDPNPLLCLPSVPAYEWVCGFSKGYYSEHFRALPRSGGKMAPIVEVVEND